MALENKVSQDLIIEEEDGELYVPICLKYQGVCYDIYACGEQPCGSLKRIYLPYVPKKNPSE